MSDTDTPRPLPAPTPGQLLSAQARATEDFRAKVLREMGGAGIKRTSDCVTGFRHGWDAAIAFLRTEAPR